MRKRTLLLRVNPEEPEPEKIRIAADLIKQGGCVAFPTETVYGLGADALNAQAVLGVFRAKRRPLDNPPIIHVSRQEEVLGLVRNIPGTAMVLMKKFWPGPLTLIFERSEVIPDVSTAGLDTVAIRMPGNNVALSLIRESGCPIAAPSANLAGKPSPTAAKHVLDDLNMRIDAVLDGGPTNIGLESTVLDLTSDPPLILRPGGTPYEVLKRVIRSVGLSRFAVSEKPLEPESARSPGIKYRHYAPNAEVTIVEGGLQAMSAKIQELILLHRHNGKKVGVLATEETKNCYEAEVVKSLGSRYDLAMLARNLFGLLREFDAERVDIVIAEGLPTDGLGLAIMNRLRKASAYNVVRADD